MWPQNPLERMTKFDQDPVGGGVWGQGAEGAGKAQPGRLQGKGGRWEAHVRGDTSHSQGLQSLGRVGRGAWQLTPRVRSRAVEMRTPFFSPYTHTNTNPGVFSLPGTSLHPSLREPLPVLAKLGP